MEELFVFDETTKGNFLSQVDVLSDELVHLLGTSASAVYSDEEIMDLTNLLEEKGGQYVKDSVFLNVIAYLGNYFIANKGGQWKMMLSKIERNAWIPLIVYRDEKISFIKHLLEDVENEDMFLLYEIYAVMDYSAQNIDNIKK